MKNKILLYFMMIALFLSCSSPKEFVYLQDMEQGMRYMYDFKYEATVHQNDRLSISVTCKKPELALPFNIHGNNIHVAADGNVSTSTVNNTRLKPGYRVDIDGNIDFPILGKLHVDGMKVSEVTDMIKKLIVDGDYIKDPQVSLEFLNFKYTVLGAVANPGVYTVDDDRITLLEAIARAGDLSSHAKVNSVAVIREVNGEREVFVHDMRTKQLFTSPCYYLQQNDVVYVEPKHMNKDKEDRTFRIITLIISLASLVTSVFWVIK